MVALMEEKEPYLEQLGEFDKVLSANDPPALRELRKEGVARFEELGFPTFRTEDWKHTSLAPLLEVPFRLGFQPSLDQEIRQAVEAIGLGGAARLVFVNSRYIPELSAPGSLPSGVWAGNFSDALKKHPDRMIPYLGKVADFQKHIFAALNTAFLRDGAFVFIPRGQVVEVPIELVFIATGDRTASYPRTLVVAGQSSQAMVMEKYLGTPGDLCFTNGVTELVVEENAHLDHCKLQHESPEAFHLANTQVFLERSSRCFSTYVSLGGRWVRNESRVRFRGEGGEATLNGLYLGSGSQHLDNQTVIDHAFPHCTSHELYKGILDDRAQGVFNGRIYVRPDAQKTDAKQTNQVLLLSEEATINTKPQLEIFADDVKCTHGATVGQLDADGIFYLRSRGIDREEARRLLTYAFAQDIIGRVKNESLRTQLERLVTARQRARGQFVPEAV